MEFILSLTTMLIAFVAMLAINYVVYKREKTLLEINEKYKRFYNLSLEECVELKSILVRTDKEKYKKYYNYFLDDWGELKRLLIRTDKEKEAYKKAIDDCIEMFNATYSNTRLSFDEAKCAFVIKDIDVDDNLPTEEEITQQTENNNENK